MERRVRMILQTMVILLTIGIIAKAQTTVGNGQFIFVNADTDEDIQRINQGDVITIPAGANYTVRYIPAQPVGSIRFTMGGGVIRVENEAPYSIAGDANGNYSPWVGISVGFGQDQFGDLTANLYSEPDAKGTLFLQESIYFEIKRDPPSEHCPGSETILWEYWDNVSGTTVPAIPVGTPPTRTDQLNSFEGPTNIDTNYGARIRGYICPPVTGDYIFWIASNDHSELWLSTDDNPANKRRIASLTNATDQYEWEKFPSQKSARIALTTGQRYYIEALHKQGLGSDHIAVGWRIPGGTLDRPISGAWLSPAEPSDNIPPVVRFSDPDDTHIFIAPADVPIGVDASDPDGNITNVEFFGGSVKLGEDRNAPYSFVWEDLEPGIYTITAKATDNGAATTTSQPVTFKVMMGECFSSGSISRDYWSGVRGARVSDIPLDSEPTRRQRIPSFSTSDNRTNYGARIRGFLCPPVTGDYIFYISSNDHSELWLSTDNDPSNKQRIAYVTGATDPDEWDKFRSQTSSPVHLAAGKSYYIEALHKQGIGLDHLTVAWRNPNGIFEAPIRGDYLSPFDYLVGGRMMASEDKSKTSLEQISIYPNPATGNDRELTITGYQGIGETIETEVEIINMTGEVVFEERILCGGNCSSYLMSMNKGLVPGVYLVNMKSRSVRSSKRLLVK